MKKETTKLNNVNQAITLDVYQHSAMSTAIYPREIGLAYTSLGLSGESGEISNKVKKVYRDKDGKLADEDRFFIADELGDALWYIAAIAKEINLPLSYIAARNLKKLDDRAQRGTLSGSGDKR